MKVYPDIPGVSIELSDAQMPQSIPEGAPRVVGLGWSAKDKFSDGTPIHFNQPYLFTDPTAIGVEIGNSPLADVLGQFLGGAGTAYIPVAVRIGYPFLYSRVVDGGAGGKAYVEGDYTGYVSGDITVTYNTSTDVSVDLPDGSTVTVAPGSTSIDLTSQVGLEITLENPSDGETFTIPVTARITGDSADSSGVTAIADTANTGSGTVVVTGAYAGQFNATIKVKYTSSGWQVSFDDGITWEDLPTDENGNPYIPEAGLTLNVSGTPADGDAWSFTVTYAREPKNADEKYKALQDGYQVLLGYPADYVIPADTYMDEPITNFHIAVAEGDPDDQPDMTASDLNFAYQLARFCYQNSGDFHNTMGAVGVKPPQMLTRKALKTWVNGLVNNSVYANGFYATSSMTLNGEPIADREGNLIDIGRFIVVVPGTLKFSGNKTSPAYAYAFGYTVSDLANPHIGPTNKRLPATIRLLENITLDLANQLVGARYTTLANSKDGFTYIVLGLTAAQSTSAYTKISTMRVMNSLLNSVRNITKPYIGRPNSPQNRAAMQTQIQSLLANATGAGWIRGGRVSVVSSGADEVLGNVYIYLEFWPFFEIREIRVVARVNLNEGTEAA